jgi:hypothetical protein
MTETRTRVAIVVEPEFTGHLIELARHKDVWIADTPHNRAMAEDLWRRETRDSYCSLTTFQIDSSAPPERWVINILGTVDEHHGLCSEWAVDVELEVRGVNATANIQVTLQECGSFVIEELNDGFIARRTPSVEQAL